MKTSAACILVALALGACNAAKTPGRGEILMSDQEVIAKDDEICRGYGAAPGTPVYIQCRAMQDQRRDAYKEARRRN
ncbi:MAG: hypothetical protein K2X71_23330 [Methylobacterium sp.]|uniref:hypothetical protein n=1 Tax=Methylobacterium sp. TaxID=409 RepID=UPI00258F0220|nr:hypothetical protein [Methylobacterium sp.]MBY0298928.1 hypothetical protein [Methylobacterium sp.]MBY0360676.1 hypothetical protein [Phreatobacter sp.]